MCNVAVRSRRCLRLTVTISPTSRQKFIPSGAGAEDKSEAAIYEAQKKLDALLEQPGTYTACSVSSQSPLAHCSRRRLRPSVGLLFVSLARPSYFFVHSLWRGGGYIMIHLLVTMLCDGVASFCCGVSAVRISTSLPAQSALGLWTLQRY